MTEPRDKLPIDPMPRKDLELPPMAGPNGQRLYTETELKAAIAAAMQVKPLEWQINNNRGGLWAKVEVGHYLSIYYTIEQDNCELASVCFSISCHEFGDEEIWKGPVSQAKAAAEADWKRILSNLFIPTDAMAALAERERLAEQRGFDRAKERAARIIKTYYPCVTGSKWAALILAMEGAK